jgi:MFS family permease
LGPAVAAAFALYGVNRLVVSGVLNATLGLLLQREVGEQIQIAGRSLGVATLTGSGLGLSTLIAMACAPVVGALSDRTANRWSVVAGGLVPGVAGFALLTIGAPWSIVAGIPLTALASGSNQSLSTTLVGDLSRAGERGKRLGMLFTVGDLAAAIGPPLAYALIPALGIRGGYVLSAGALAVMLFAALWLGSGASEARGS